MGMSCGAPTCTSPGCRYKGDTTQAHPAAGVVSASCTVYRGRESVHHLGFCLALHWRLGQSCGWGQGRALWAAVRCHEGLGRTLRPVRTRENKVQREQKGGLQGKSTNNVEHDFRCHACRTRAQRHGAVDWMARSLPGTSQRSDLLVEDVASSSTVQSR